MIMPMKRVLITAVAALLLPVLAEAGQRDSTGYRIIAYPLVGHSSDLGFQYGMNATLYGHHPGTPKDRDTKYYFEVSRYSKGQLTFKSMYDSFTLIPGIHLTAVLAYQTSPLYRFYGFNGSVTPYDRSLDKKNGMAYYSMDRKLVRAAATVQGDITEHLSWGGGANFLSYSIGQIDEKYGYDTQKSIYNEYVGSGLVRAEEADGGHRLECHAGLAYDSRDYTSVPSRGIWAELFVTGSPDIFGDGFSYTKLSARFRHYVSMGARVTFAYSLAYQGIMTGSQPFYMIQNINSLTIKKSINEGLGNKSTLRGTVYNRLLGDGYAWANFELRTRVLDFDLFRHSFSVIAYPFMDVGAITDPFRLDGDRGGREYRKATQLHESLGAGVKLMADRGMLLSVEVARPLNPDDGRFGFTFGSKFIF